MALNLEVSRGPDAAEWQAYIDRHPESSIFHLPQWKSVLAESFPHQPVYVSARDGGRLCGLLPLAEVNSRLTGRRLVSLPFAHVCGPIADDDGTRRALIDRAFSLAGERRCRYVEIRSARELALDADTGDGYVTYVLELTDPDRIWKTLNMRRRSIKKARESGVTVSVDDSAEGLRIFDRLNQVNKRDMGVPAQPLRFLEAIRRNMQPWYHLYLGYYQGKPAAGIITLSYGENVNYAFGASDPAYLSLRPNDLTMWQAIVDSCGKGYRNFDFGKTSKSNEGLVNFKKHWGTREVPLRYYTYPRSSRSLSSGRTGKGYERVTGIWKRLPLFVTRRLGPMAFRHLD